MGDKPLYRVGVAGLDPRDVRLIEIVFRHSQYNRYEFRLVELAGGESFELLIANALDPAGRRASAAARERSVPAPVIEAMPRGAPVSARHAISIDRLTLQLLPILNRVVELELRAQPAAAVAPAGQPARSGYPASDPIRQAQRSASPLPGGGRESAAITSAASAAQPAASPAPPSPAPVTAQPREPAGGVWQAPAPMPYAGAEPERSPLAPSAASGANAQPGAAAPAPAAPGGAAAATAATAAARRVREPAGSERPAPASGESAAPRSNLVPFPAAGAADAQAAPRLRVLVVDDSPTVRRQLTVAFDRLGLGCETVASAAQALERLAREHFDLALVDVVMPDSDGYKLTREIKRDKRLRQMPVIILTSRSSPFDLARGALAGCDAYLSKPVPFRALEAAVVRQLRKSLAIDDLTGYMRSASGTVPGAGATRPESRLGRFFRR